MNSDSHDRYHAALEGRLKIVGFTRKEEFHFGEKIRDFDPELQAARWSFEKCSFLISKGCARYPGANSGWFDEFLVETSKNTTFSEKILEVSIYYHLTKRPLELTDVIEIGAIPENTQGYSHIFISVPFFLPGSVNVIELNGARYGLQWLMPIFPAEAAFIEEHGTDEFETKLKASPYDYFDIRSDLTYLDQ